MSVLGPVELVHLRMRASPGISRLAFKGRRFLVGDNHLPSLVAWDKKYIQTDTHPVRFLQLKVAHHIDLYLAHIREEFIRQFKKLLGVGLQRSD